MDPTKYLFVYLDLEMITSTSTPTRLYQYMLKRIASKVQQESAKNQVREISQLDSIDTYDLAEALDTMEDEGLHIVLLIDEFENVGDNLNFGPDFYYGLRSLAIHHDLALITATRVDLVEIAHSEAIRSSPFFNIFATINMPSLSSVDIKEMLDIYLADTGISFNDSEVDYAITLAGRLPFFVQMALHFLYQAHQEGVDESGRIAYLEERVNNAAAPHIENYWQNSSDNEKTVLALLTLQDDQNNQLQYKKPSELEQWFVHSGQALSGLTNRGLVIKNQDQYALASIALRRWINGELTAPSKEVDPGERQKLEGILTASLPQDLAGAATQWLRKTNTNYKALFAQWLSDSRTSEKALDLLNNTKVPFQELKGEAPVRADSGNGAPGDQVLEALSTVTEAERKRAEQLASLEGTISIMFTDLEGSTELLTSLGDEENQALLRTHNNIIREHLNSNGGVEVKSMGDGFMIVFPSARKAVACAAGIQRGLEKFNKENTDRQLKVRVGINVGETIKEEDFFGTAVVMAARVMDRASGGQILVTDLFRKLAGSTSNFQYVDYGSTQLKGFSEEEHLHEVDWRSSTG